jgi:Fe-S cluster biogenesis protein NfuA
MNNSEFQAHAEKIEQLLQQVNAVGDGVARTAALDLMQSLMDLHGAGLSRIVELLSDSGETGSQALSKIAADPLVCGLLVLYGIHPVPSEERVRQAIGKLGPQLQKTGARLELMSVADGVVRVNVQSSRPDAHSTTAVRATIEQAVREAAPEIVEIVIEGMLPAGFVPLSMIQPAMRYEGGEAI